MNGTLLMLGVAGPELTAGEAAMFTGLQPAGFILLSHNFVSGGQVRRLTDALRGLSRSHPLMAVEPGGGGELWSADFGPVPPSPAALAAHGDANVTGTAGVLTAELLRMLGINLYLGPVLDLDHGGGAPGGLREGRWGRDPQRVIDHAGQWNRWLRKRGVASCAGHFPAGGRGAGSPLVIEELLREDLLPYTALGPELDAIMVSHTEFSNLDSGVPAAFSERVVRRLLRDQLGFDHHLVLAAGSGVEDRLAIAAGCDLAIINRQTQGARAAAKAIGALPVPVLAEAWERVERMRDKLQWPHPWSITKWEQTLAGLSDFAATVPVPGVAETG
ncbi:MAG: hypothetical protein K9N23_19730 [Akkermansiaceae bacterium]|nr:hypothetical protein [Akkermansiaceae bacterium]MCF7733928.1 hypothetical protein [Akkermansiaceae bacterium]